QKLPSLLAQWSSKLITFRLKITSDFFPIKYSSKEPFWPIYSVVSAMGALKHLTFDYHAALPLDVTSLTNLRTFRYQPFDQWEPNILLDSLSSLSQKPSCLLERIDILNRVSFPYD